MLGPGLESHLDRQRFVFRPNESFVSTCGWRPSFNRQVQPYEQLSQWSDSLVHNHQPWVLVHNILVFLLVQEKQQMFDRTPLFLCKKGQFIRVESAMFCFLDKCRIPGRWSRLDLAFAVLRV